MIDLVDDIPEFESVVELIGFVVAGKLAVL